MECHARTINELILQDAVVKAINQMLGDKSSYQAQLQLNIASVIRASQATSVENIDEKLMAFVHIKPMRQNSRKISIFSGLFLNYSEEKQGGQLPGKPSTPFELFFSMQKQFFYFISFFQNSQSFKYLYRIYHSLIIRSLFFLKMSMIHNIHIFFQKLPLFS